MGNVVGSSLVDSIGKLLKHFAKHLKDIGHPVFGITLHPQLDSLELLDLLKKNTLEATEEKLSQLEEKKGTKLDRVVQFEALRHTAEQEFDMVYVEAQKLLFEPPTGEGATSTSDTFEQATSAMNACHENVMCVLKQGFKDLQAHYDSELERVELQLRVVKQKEDELWANTIEGIVRPARTSADNGPWQKGSDEKGRVQEVSKIVGLIEKERAKVSQTAMKLAEQMNAKAQVAKEVSHQAEAVKQAKLKKMITARELEKQRRKESQQDEIGVASSQKTLEDKAKLMIEAGNVDFDALRQLAMGGYYVWGWTEDGDRFNAQAPHLKQYASKDNPHFVLYGQSSWAEIEGHYQVFLHSGRLNHYRFVTVNVGGSKLFNLQTGLDYSIDLLCMQQRNMFSNFVRATARVCSLNFKADSPQLHQVIQQRQDAVKDAEKACLEAKRCWQEASLAEHQAALALEQAETKASGSDASKFKVPYPSGETVGEEKIVTPGWLDMGDEFYSEVELFNAGEHQAEFERIRQYFLKSMPQSKVYSVKRIQNKLLWQLYAVTRKRVGDKPMNNGNPNEEMFFHGAGNGTKGITAKIMCSGFDVQFGNGLIWLSTNSSYSSSNGHCEQTKHGTKIMLLVRCTLGNVSVDSNHCGGESTGHIRRDDQSFIKGSDNRYTISNNCQVYPAYLIEFEFKPAARL